VEIKRYMSGRYKLGGAMSHQLNLCGAQNAIIPSGNTPSFSINTIKHKLKGSI